ncbi:hypothetical protein GPUN_1172 [Glaciecola punicea ACAM 611]|uniref:Uncharacterized protein n=1 Tax=Glaciecola punicea ACAM 611 TaxID=1121923 RepID=H5TAH4_9ALTE|nr:hypothetical protein GPUN_1172 [Glaciecola punicea ACAM 611]
MDSAKQHVQKYSQPSKESSIISNNLIIHTATSHPFADVGIGIESSPPDSGYKQYHFFNGKLPKRN